PEPTPGKMGPIFEMRYYTLKGGTLPDTAKRWEAALPERIKLSPVVFAGGVEFGRANGFIHIWAYQDMNQRMQVRDEARKKVNGAALPAGLIAASAAAACFPGIRVRKSGRSIGDVMIDDVLTFDASAPLWRAAQLMRDGNVGVLPVVEDGRLRGIVTDRDL